ncbi:MAG: alpha-glucan family phosphorylase [Planctomycetes bacterium]|nr:alpha-glucan family phosphorylase [Planctomycetota bacterium]
MNLKNLFVYPKLPDNLSKLQSLAYNLWGTWNYEAIRLFYRIDAQLFRAVNHNPIQFLVNLPSQRIAQLAEDRGFLFELERVWARFQEYLQYDSQFQIGTGTAGPQSRSSAIGNPVLGPTDTIAYFAMEFGLHECIPTYSGGLGVLSGDFLKASSDLNLPVVGVGLIYKYGYFTQHINMKGEQEEQFIEFDNHLVPLHEVRNPEGGKGTPNAESGVGDPKAYIEMSILGQPVQIKLWQIDVGKIRLLLLDTDLPENPPHLRDITYELYVSDRAKRLQQELVLGIGGVRALERLRIMPQIYHINEGHAAFLILARLQKLMRENGMSFLEAKALIRASTVFTTHTPVIAGNENFDAEMVKEYIENDVRTLGLSFEDLASDAYINHEEKTFWLPALAIRFSRYVNAVSRMHRDVSRQMWAGLFPHMAPIELPIDYVTNGVHHSWLSEPVAELLSRYIGPDYVRCDSKSNRWDGAFTIDDEEVWRAHHENKLSLITFVRKKLADDLTGRGYIQSKILKLTRALNPEYLTIVYARRFARYKRATLLLRDKDRLAKILTNTTQPVQLLFAGKAHPADTVGKSMIKEILDFAREHQVEDRVVFLENYDINVARHLAWGADVWLNNPVRENEASGTSGMKAGMNGVLNLSVLDGWWPEGYTGRNGWAITGAEYDHQFEMQEAAEAEQIYDLIEDEITELYYDRNEAGVPVRWVQMMKESISSICCQFNMNRVLADYADKFYGPSRTLAKELSRDNYGVLRRTVRNGQELLANWDKIVVTGFSTSVDASDVVTEGQHVEVTCRVDLHGAPAGLLAVELFYMLSEQNERKIVPMRPKNAAETSGVFGCAFDIDGRGQLSMNARIRPASPILQDLYPDLVKWAQ